MVQEADVQPVFFRTLVALCLLASWGVELAQEAEAEALLGAQFFFSPLPEPSSCRAFRLCFCEAVLLPPIQTPPSQQGQILACFQALPRLLVLGRVSLFSFFAQVCFPLRASSFSWLVFQQMSQRHTCALFPKPA